MNSNEKEGAHIWVVATIILLRDFKFYFDNTEESRTIKNLRASALSLCMLLNSIIKNFYQQNLKIHYFGVIGDYVTVRYSDLHS